ncbi:DUF6503 family protein [Winogradskyella sediminis]|uniref:Uncharacterized protein n=1 Tax=Winogradskyella sediminis TaxID=1382466 RepID=A0A1H1SL13_9FLAO|nr:DUF6503 family protein [Winogradskyella sediminis]SDS48416.1 hypothetical protein SAMN04489797_1698 [Winogradskyella sediminis]
MSYMLKSGLIGLLLLTLVVSCKNEKKETKAVEITESAVTETVALTPVETIEKAYNKEAFLSHDAISLDMVINFGGNERLNGKMTFLTNSTKGKIELNDGASIYYDGAKVFHSKNLKNEKAARFDAYTWMYFLLFPNKLSDDGTIWSDVETLNLDDTSYNAQTLTFEANTGDAPDDWYIVYSDPKTHMIDYVAYIVTVNKSKAAAESDPHAIGYTNYKMIEDVPVAHHWEFYEWSKDNGLGKVIGNATLSNVEFVKADADTFSIPEGFVEK